MLDPKTAAKKFSERWKGRGYEKGESQKFWIDLLQTIFGVENATEYISFEDQVHLDHTSFIDGYIPATKVMIEQKSLGKDLRKAIKQSDGTMLNPFQQAKRYITELPRSLHPKWVITCNFESFLVYNMEQPNSEPEEILLENLENDYYRLNFLVDNKQETAKKELDLSIKAGDLIGEIYDLFLKQYKNPDSVESLQSLNKLCVRLVFCMYAEDANLFPEKNYFQKYTQKYTGSDYRESIIKVFKVLDTPENERDPYLDDGLNAFPYVNGGLFKDEFIEIPRITEELREAIIHASDFDWSLISPTIFGAVFESTLNPVTRRSGGMHYTSCENIHKVIDPLFFEALNDEFKEIRALPPTKNRNEKLLDFQGKIAKLKFFDPACGSGNFLTETYISLRRLENDIINLLHNGQMVFGTEGFENPIKVSIDNFYGIEINDFAVTVAKTALWIAESQMMNETKRIIMTDLNFLPLKTNATIVEGNALRLNWEEIVPKAELNYIIGNPPFVGYSLQSKEQKEDILNIYVDEKGKPYKTAGKIDYVAGWYFKAAQFISQRQEKASDNSLNSYIKVAFVSTNSITQGEQVAAVWKPLYDRFGIKIDFAHKTFRWDSEASLKAHVHCVIVGFNRDNNEQIAMCKEQCSKVQSPTKRLYEDGRFNIVSNINPYLIEADNIFIESRSKPICDVPAMTTGNRPADGGNLIIESEDYDEFIRKEPNAIKYIKNLTGAEEYINNKKRYCLWLVGASPAEIKKMPEVMKRVEACRQARLGGAPDRQKLADTPTVFRETKNPERYIIVPSTSSESRRYIPLGFLDKNTIPTNANLIIPDATLYHFGVLTSSVHMNWMRAVCGRLEMRYRYSKDIVYNNFPWPNPTPEQKAKIEATAQAILDARNNHPDCSLADLYDETLMPPDLRKAHQANDKAVMEAYGLSVKETNESDCVSFLMNLYRQLTS